MDFDTEFSNFKYDFRKAQEIDWDHIPDNQEEDEMYRQADKKALDVCKKSGLLFMYKNSGTMLPEYSTIYIFDRSGRNTVLEEGSYGDTKSLKYMSISDETLAEIKKIIQENPKVLDIKSENIPDAGVLDGTYAEFFLCNSERATLIRADNLWAWTNKEHSSWQEPTEELLLLLAVRKEIAKLLYRSNIPRDYVRL